MDNKYLIFGQARSGTTSLSACFNVDGVKVAQEPTCIQTGDKYLIEEEIKKFNFHTDFPEDYDCSLEEFPLPQYHNPWDLSLKDKKVCYQFLNSIYARFDGIKHIWGNNCFKTNYNIIDYAKEKSVSIIFMYRKNQFDFVKSAHISVGTKVSQLTIEGISKEAISKVKSRISKADIKPINVKHSLNRIRRSTRALKLFWEEVKKTNCYLLAYEDLYLSSNQEKEFEKVCRFLNLNDSQINKEVFKKIILNKDVKQTDGAMSMKIPNIDEYNQAADAHRNFCNFTLK
jgi:hypothetical protein|tara:strand:+ start:23392 stop:24249 length:858 start_codon:yes stop_codon:yes gene_type:complete